MSAFGLTARFPSLSAFRYPAYVRIWFGAFVSNAGTWVQTISIGVYVTETTGRVGWTGSIAALSYLPAVLLAPISGALADRIERRRMIVPLVVVQALAASALAILALLGHLPLGAIGALVFLNGCAGALAGPAFNALLSDLVEPEDLLSALSLTSGQFNLARTVGPMLAAVVLASGGITLAFVVNALSYFAVLIAVLASPKSIPTSKRPTESVWRGIIGGFQAARRDPGIRLALPLVLLESVLIAPFIGLMPAFAIKCFGRGAAAASMLAMSQGVGALVAAFTANALADRWGVKSLLSRALLLLAPIAAAYWLAPWYGLAFAILALLGGVYLWSLAALSTTCMGRVPRELQARINSLYIVTLSGGYSIGLVVQGWLADRVGLRIVPAVAAGMVLVVALILKQRKAFDALDLPAANSAVPNVSEAATAVGNSRI